MQVFGFNVVFAHNDESSVSVCCFQRGRLKRYRGLISCVLFMGGEWQPEALQKMLGIVTQAGLKACLYTGLEREELEAVSDGILPYLTYLKTGRWQMELGGLDSPTTNQKFIDLRTGEVLNRLFIKDKPAPKIIPITTQPQAAAFQTALKKSCCLKIKTCLSGLFSNSIFRRPFVVFIR